MQPIVAYRGYELDDDRAKLKGVKVTWEQRQLTAKCSGHNTRQSWYEFDDQRRARARKHLLTANRKRCFCGVHGSWKPSGHGILEADVVTRVVFWGAVEMAELGLRAEHARIEVIYVKSDSVSTQSFNKVCFGLALRYKGAKVIVMSRAAMAMMPDLTPKWDVLDWVISEEKHIGVLCNSARMVMGYQNRKVLAEKLLEMLGQLPSYYSEGFYSGDARARAIDAATRKMRAFEQTGAKGNGSTKKLIEAYMTAVGVKS